MVSCSCGGPTRPVWVSVLVLGIMHGLALSVPIGISSRNWQAGIVLGLIDTVAIGAVSYPWTARRRRRLYKAADPIAPERLPDSLRVAFRGPERTDRPDVLAAGRRITEERIFNADEPQMLNIVATVIVELIFIGLSVWASPWWCWPSSVSPQSPQSRPKETDNSGGVSTCCSS